MQHAAMPLTREELDHLSASTLAHYNTRAQDYWQGTRDHDVSQNIATLLRHIESAAPLSILDLGCGPGRDLKAFSELGHRVIGLEALHRLRPWRARTAAASSGSRTCWHWTCRQPSSTGCSPTPYCFMFRARSFRACYSPCMQRSSRAAFCSVPTHEAKAKRAGKASASAPFTISPHGAATWPRPALSSWSTTFAPTGFPPNSNPG